MLAKAGLVMALLLGLVGTGIGSFPASAQLNNEEQVINQPGSGSGAGVLINEVEMNPRGKDAGKEWVELYNPTQSDVSIGNFAIQTRTLKSVISIPAGTVIGAGQFHVVEVEGEVLVDFGETLALVDPSGKTVDTVQLLDRRNDDRTWQRIPDGSDTWRFITATKGEPNDPDTYQKSAKDAELTSVPSLASETATAPQCLGSALCIEGKVIRMVDTDTLYVEAGEQKYRVDLSLTKVSRSDKTYEGGSEITKHLCLGNDVLVDQDDGQPRVRRVNDATSITAVVYCSSHNLNQELLDSGFVSLDSRQCSVSEFAGQDWAVRHGCR